MMAHSGSVICVGETLVDLFGDASASTPYFGGSQANVAVGAARFGARSVLVGGAGDDRWGQWLRDALVAEGVDTSLFTLVDGAETPRASVTVSPDGEPSFSFSGDAAIGVAAGAAQLDALFAAGDGVLVFGSDTLIETRERAVTRRACELAAGHGWVVLFDPNLRGPRWVSENEMIETARSFIPGCSVVKANLGEARALTGHDEPDRAARALLDQGAEAAVVTLGAEGIAIAAGNAEVMHVPAAPARMLDATGAGDAVAAVVAAALAQGVERSQLVDVAALATRIAARVVETRGAIDGLPPAGEARASLRSVLGR